MAIVALHHFLHHGQTNATAAVATASCQRKIAVKHFFQGKCVHLWALVADIKHPIWANFLAPHLNGAAHFTKVQGIVEHIAYRLLQPKHIAL